jgi:hypothetical protein
MVICFKKHQTLFLVFGIFVAFSAGMVSGKFLQGTGAWTKTKILFQSNDELPKELFNAYEEQEDASKFLGNLDILPFSNQLVYDALSLPEGFKEIEIVQKKIQVEEYISDSVKLRKYKVWLNNKFQFSFLEISNVEKEVNRTLIFLHGNKCNPEELLGLRPAENADPVVYDLAMEGFKILIPYKFDMYKDNYSEILTARSAISGTTLEALEQIKIKILCDQFRSNTGTLEIFGFSHGAWQALIASHLNQVDAIYFHDLLMNPQFLSKPSFYTDYDEGVASLYNFAAAFNSANAAKVVVLVGKQSGHYSENLEFVNSVSRNVRREKVNIVHYDGGHYIDSGLIKEHVMKW